MSEKTRKFTCVQCRREKPRMHNIQPVPTAYGPLCQHCYSKRTWGEKWADQCEAEREGFDICATLRRVLPEGSTIWTVTQHVTRSGRVTVLPMAFLASPADPAQGDSIFGAPTVVASRRYVLGREFCEKLGYRWDTQHQGWLGNYGEDASGSIVAALSMATYDRPDAYSLGRTA